MEKFNGNMIKMTTLDNIKEQLHSILCTISTKENIILNPTILEKYILQMKHQTHFKLKSMTKSVYVKIKFTTSIPIPYKIFASIQQNIILDFFNTLYLFQIFIPCFALNTFCNLTL